MWCEVKCAAGVKHNNVVVNCFATILSISSFAQVEPTVHYTHQDSRQNKCSSPVFALKNDVEASRRIQLYGDRSHVQASNPSAKTTATCRVIQGPF